MTPFTSWLLLLTGAGLLISLIWEIASSDSNNNDQAIQQKNTSINSLDVLGFRDLGAWYNSWGVSYIGTLKDYKKLAETDDLTPFRLIKNFSFLGEFHVNDLTTKFGRWVDSK